MDAESPLLRDALRPLASQGRCRSESVEPFRALPLTVSVNAQPSVALEPSDCMGPDPWPSSCCRLPWGELGQSAMTPSIISLQDILKHCRTLPPSRRAFYEAVLTHDYVLAARGGDLPGRLLWLRRAPPPAPVCADGSRAR